MNNEVEYRITNFC